MENTKRAKVEREQVAFRLTKVGKGLLEDIADYRGVSLTAIIEQLIRSEAAQLGLRDGQAPAQKLSQESASE